MYPILRVLFFMLIATKLYSFNESLQQSEATSDNYEYSKFLNIHNLYIGFGISEVSGYLKEKYINSSEVELNGNVKENLFNLFVGYYVLPMLAIEAEVDRGLVSKYNIKGLDSKGSPGLIPVQSLTTYYWSNLKLQPRFKGYNLPYLKAGVGYANNHYRLDGADKDDKINFKIEGFSYKLAVGYDLKLNNNNSIIFEYAKYKTPRVYMNLARLVFPEAGEFLGFGGLTLDRINISYKYTF